MEPKKLPDVLMGWLGSKLQGLNLPPLPTEWTLPTTVDFLLKAMKLDWDSMQQMLVEAVGADNVALVVKVFEQVQALLGGGAEGVYTLLDKAAGEIGYTADQLLRDALAAATKVVTEALPQAALAFVAKKLALGPGVGALLSLYDGITWLLDPQTVEQIKKVVEPAIEGVKAVARGDAQAQQFLANKVKEALLAGVPVALNFAIKQVPLLEELPSKVSKALLSVHDAVKAKLTAWVKVVKDKVAGAFKSRPGQIGEVQKFNVPGSAEQYELWLARGADGKLTIMLDGIGAAAKLDLQKDLPKGLSTEMRQKIGDAVTKVLTQGEELAKLLSSKPARLKEALALQSATGAFGRGLKELADALLGAPCERLLAACFAAGTLLRTPGGLQAIEAVRAGDRVLSRDEHDARGGVDYQVVEAVFERLGRVWHLTASGRLIRTTGEHPFHELGRGWVPCRELGVGDRLLCEDGTTVTVEEVVDTGAVEVVYNLRVADWHTYFVGGHDWGFSVWAHNLYLKADTVNGQVVIRTASDTAKKYYISEDRTRMVQGAGDAWHPTLEQAKNEAGRLTTLSNNFLKALQAADPTFTEDMADGLLLRYGRKYYGDFSPTTAAETSAALLALKPDQDASQAEFLYGTTALFFALTSATKHGDQPGHRPRLDWKQATAVFAALNAAMKNNPAWLGWVNWIAPTEPNFNALASLKPTTTPGGYALPDPVAANPRYKTVPTAKGAVAAVTAHEKGALYEELLAYQVHGGKFGAAEIVVRWGDKIGTNGSDVISVNPTTGQVTLWDSKYRQAPGPQMESETFTDTSRRKKARDQAIDVIGALPSERLSADLKQKAVASLRSFAYLQKTVRYQDGSELQQTAPTPKESPVPAGG